MNVVAAFPECIAQPSADDPDLKETMLEIFAHSAPEVKALIALADKVTVSPIQTLSPSSAPCHQVGIKQLNKP